MDHRDAAESVGNSIEGMVKNAQKQIVTQVKKSVNDAYTQLESLAWLQRRLAIKGPLPALRGWPVSPDFLLRLHSWIIKHQPKVVVETGSGATTIVIADALRQNGFGKLFSFEHLDKFADVAWGNLVDEHLQPWVTMRTGELEPWLGEHLNPIDAEKPSLWYPLNLDGVEQIELLLVDGPPGGTCQYARYPAVPALLDRLALNAEVWMDDANRDEEKAICQSWAEQYGFDLEHFPLEKGLCVLYRKSDVQA